MKHDQLASSLKQQQSEFQQKIEKMLQNQNIRITGKYLSSFYYKK